jgi:transcriptional regulator with XRE-family HTH domain
MDSENISIRNIGVAPDIEKATGSDNGGTGDEILGKKIREIRNQRGITLKVMADISSLNINTLSLIENGKTSPSISTLQRLAGALEISIKEFFEPASPTQPVIFTAHDKRPEALSEKSIINNLGKGLSSSTLEPFVLTMEKHATSGGRTLLHNGYEFVFCLSGKILYFIQENEYTLTPGDSIIFSAQLGHRWENINEGESQLLLVLTPACVQTEQSKKHFYTFEGV